MPHSQLHPSGHAMQSLQQVSLLRTLAPLPEDLNPKAPTNPRGGLSPSDGIGRTPKGSQRLAELVHVASPLNRDRVTLELVPLRLGLCDLI